jgi:transcriptional regulator with XRE-family HTH domain
MRIWLRQARKDRGLTQAQLGELAGMSNKTVSHLELGRVAGRVKAWDRLEEILGIPQQELRREEAKEA